LQTLTTLVFGLRYAGCYLQLSNVNPTQVINGGTSKGIGNLNSAFEKALLEQKLTGSQFQRHFKNSKTIRNAYLGQDLSLHVNHSSIHLVTQSL
jgi:hypothetical protein